MEFLAGRVVDAKLAHGNPVCDAVLLSPAVGNDTVAPTLSEVVATCEVGSYESDVVSERRTRHRVTRPSQTTRIGCGASVPIREGYQLREAITSDDDRTGRANATEALPRAHTNGRGGPGAYAYSMAPPTLPVKPPPLGGRLDFEAVARALSRERLNPYLQDADNDPTQALALYEWNEDVGSAFQIILSRFEVTFRNSIDRCLVDAYGRDWLTDGRARLDHVANARVDKVLNALRHQRKSVQPPNIIAALPLGFWVSLLGSGGLMARRGPKADYETTIWRKAVRNAFPCRERLVRRTVHALVTPLHKLRNRIAHCEPIYHLDLALEHQRILDVTGWMSPEMRKWIIQKTEVPRLLGECPVVASRR